MGNELYKYNLKISKKGSKSGKKKQQQAPRKVYEIYSCEEMKMKKTK